MDSYQSSRCRGGQPWHTLGVDSSNVSRLRLELRSVDPTKTYFAFTILDRDGRRHTSVQSRFVGWPPGRSHGAVEVREAAPILTDVMTRIWYEQGETWIAVSTAEHLYIYLHVGGHAIVETSLAERYFPQLVKPHVVLRSGPFGFETFDPAAREVRIHRHRPSQRRRVLERDNSECQKCGARQEDGAELVLHHIRMFSRGGPTTAENLITLCTKCHDGLNPHEDETLFFRPGGHVDRFLERETSDAHRCAVAAYRSRMSQVVTPR